MAESHDRRRVRPLAIHGGWIALGVVVALGLVAAAFVASGHYAATADEFDWGVGAETGTAVGTLLLAITTVGLGWVTEQAVAVAWEEQRSREQPTVIVESCDPTGRIASGEKAGGFGAYVVLRNVGLGPALNVRICVKYVGEQPNLADTPLEAIREKAVIMAGESTGQVHFDWWKVEDYDEAQGASGMFAVTGTCTDRQFRQPLHPIRTL